MKENNMLKISKAGMFVLSFVAFTVIMSSATLVSATSIINATLQNGTQRIVPTGGVSVTLTWNVTNTDESTHIINETNITNATNYKITSVTAPTGWTCTIGAADTNCTNTSTTGIAAGSSINFSVVVTTPGDTNSGVTSWYINTTDTNSDGSSVEVKILAIDGGDIGFDIRDELGYSQTGANVTLDNSTSELTVITNNITDNGGDNDAAADGLVIFDDGVEISGSANGNYNYSVGIEEIGFVIGAEGSNIVWQHEKFKNGNRVDLQYFIKITVQDELGNALTGATVNVSMIMNATSETYNSTITPNRTDGGNYYFALDTGIFNNTTTFIVSKSGFITNGSVSGTYYAVNNTTQLTTGSVISMNYSIKLNVSDELDVISAMGTGLTFYMNDTITAEDQQSSNFYYFNMSANGYNITAYKAGYVNSSYNSTPVNTSAQAEPLIKMNFSMKVGIQTELGGNLTASSGTYRINNTITTPDGTDSDWAYFARTEAAGNVYVNVSYVGYVNNSSSESDLFRINTTVYAVNNVSLPFTLKVMNITDELNTTVFTVDGSEASAAVDGNTTVYSNNYAYIPTAGGSTVDVVAFRDSFVNETKQVTASDGSQTMIVFNESGAAGMQNGTGLNYTIKVLGVWDELGNMSFTLYTGNNNVSIEYNESGNVTYSGGYAYINITGGSGEKNITAYRVGWLGFVNQTLNITPSNTTQKTVLFNATDQAGADELTGGLKYMLKINVTDELSGTDNMNTGVTFAFNTSGITPNTTSGTVYYFLNVSELDTSDATVINLTAIRSGYVNKSDDIVRLNASVQAFETIAMDFALRVNVTNELGGVTNMDSVVTIYLNNSSVTPNSTSTNQYYYALSPRGANITVSKSGYVNKSDTAGALNGVPINASAQALRSIEMPFTLKIMNISDELNYTQFTIAANDAFVNTSGIATNYSGDNIALIAAPAGSVTIKAGKNGYVNTSITLVADETENNQTTIVFNESVSTSFESATGLDYSLKIMGLCDEINATCLTMYGNTSHAEFGGAEVVGNTTIYNDSIAYIAATGNGNANVTAFALGFVNMTQTIALTPGSAQVIGYFNSTYGLQYMIKITVVDELGQSTGMNVVDLALNESWNPTENATFWRTSASSNIYYFNHTINQTSDGFNLSVGKVGYVNLTDGSELEFTVNNTTQAVQTARLPFTVKVTVKTQASDNQLLNGSTLTIDDEVAPIVVIDGGSGDGDGDENGTIYYALNNSLMPHVTRFSVTVGNKPFTGSMSNNYTGYAINTSNQTAVTIYTIARRPFNFTTYALTANTWSRFKMPSQSQFEGKGYTATSTGDWNMSTVMTDAGLGTNYDVVYYEGTTWTTYIRSDWAGSSLQYVNNTNQFDYHVNMTQTVDFIL